MPDYRWTYYCLKRRKEIFNECTDRMYPCPKEYEERDILTSRDNMEKVDLIKEIIEELKDTINYSLAKIISLEQMRKRLTGGQDDNPGGDRASG